MKTALGLFFALCSHICLWAQSCLLFSGNRLPSTNITSICQDKEGYIWIGSENGLIRYDGYKFTTYKHNAEDSASLMFNVVSKVFCDRDGQLWIGTNNGLQRYDEATNSFIRYMSGLFERARVNDICQLPDGQVLVGTAGYGLFRAETEKRTLTPLDIYKADKDDNFFGHMMVETDGTLWYEGNKAFSIVKPGRHPQMFTDRHNPPMAFAEAGGRTLVMNRRQLCLYDNGQFVDDYYDVSETASLNPHYWTLMRDHSGNLFIGTRGNGLLWIPSGTKKVLRYHVNAPGINMNTSTIETLFEDRHGNIWVGCRHKGLLVIPSHKTAFNSWSFSEQKHDIGNYVSSICEGDNDMTWCTVAGEGVYGFDAGGRIVAHPAAPAWVEFIRRDAQGNYYVGAGTKVYSYNPLNGQSIQLLDFPCNMINDMTDDRLGHLFFSVYGRGMLCYDKATGKTTHYSQTDKRDKSHGRLCNDWILSMITDNDGRIWTATTNGVCCLDLPSGSFRPFGWDMLLEGKRCESLCETSRGDILIGTMEGLFTWHRETGKVTEFPEAERLRGLNIGYITQDRQGDIWCSTSMGIWHYRTSDGRWISHVSGSGLKDKEFVTNAGLYIPRHDRILFATNDGITAFTPEQVQGASMELGDIRLTALTFGGKSVNAPAGLDRFSFPYSDNVLSMEFSLMNFPDAANTTFEYRLNDNEEWIRNSEGQNAITFARLSVGTHQLEIRACVGEDVTPSRKYTIIIESPWYRSTTAYILYFCLLIALTVFIASSWRRRMHMKMDEDKMKFLINATHDIRSPLTLIMSPLEKLKAERMEEYSTAEEFRSFNSTVLQPSLSVIESNAHRIMNLVNQILDIRKIDKRQMNLSCRKTELSAFLQRICRYYEYNARERQIELTLSAPQNPVWAWIDRTQFEKVIANLLSNAFKYTPDNGSITVTLAADEETVKVSVTDDGQGMDEETLRHLFERFYQGHSSTHTEGTGIGLNLCKMIVEMHHGSITAGNRTDGRQGSVFCVSLPQGREHLQESEIDITEDAPDCSVTTATGQNRRRVLIVDDDGELVRYIVRELEDRYSFTVCSNGHEGLCRLLGSHKQNDLSYDIVVSDVMMPVMDGFTMLRLIKSNPLISHIPVILLTSKADIGNRLEGLKQGADAYLTKPFIMSELQITIDNLIFRTNLFRNKMENERLTEKYIEDIEMKGNDELLMERILKCINENIGNSDLDINLICSKAGISRSHLHRKMKEISGLTVHEFIQNIRMEQAARMLAEQKHNITQVAYAVGYSSQPSFSTAFRKHFGCTPSEFVNQHK